MSKVPGPRSNIFSCQRPWTLDLRLWTALLVLLAGCGASRSALREQLAASPHRHIALIPLERASTAQPYAGQVTAALATELRRAGFEVEELPPASKRAFDIPKEAAKLAKAAGVQAVMTGRIDEAFERIHNQPATYEFIPVPPERCCNHPTHPCTEKQVFDPQLQSYVGACSGSHKRVQREPARYLTKAGFALRLELVDAADGAVLWQDADRQEADDTSLARLADKSRRLLTERFLSAVITQKL
jgi:hypothetical protein